MAALALLSLPLGRVPSAHASAEFDRKYALETVGFLKAWDNVDGLFGEYVADAYRDYFSRQSRFVLQDLSKADMILTSSKIPYPKLIEDNAVLAQLARSMHSQSIIRTKILKEGRKYRIVVEWLHSPKMELLSSETFYLDEPRDGIALGFGDLKGSLQRSLDQMIRKLPFVAHVTGRDNNSVTVNIGANEKLDKGDILLVSTVDEVKVHPLLKQIVDWRMTEVGRLRVEEVDQGIAFCKVMQEESGREVQRYQKIVQVMTANPVTPDSAIPMVEGDQVRRRRDVGAAPRLGWVAAGLWPGAMGREFSGSIDGANVGRRGSGLLVGAKTEAQIWLDRDWFAEAAMAFAFSTYAQEDILNGNASQEIGNSASVLQSRFNVGYTYYATGDFYGPKGWVRFGYMSTAYTLTTNTDEYSGPASFKGPFLGVGGDYPIRERYGALMNLDFGLLTSGKTEGVSSTDPSGATAIHFFMGGYYKYDPRMAIRAGLDVMSHGADYTDTRNLTHRVIGVTTSLLFYF